MRKIYWVVQVWLCRRFLQTMTIDKVAVLAHVTGLPVESVFALHPSSRTCKHGRRVAS